MDSLEKLLLLEILVDNVYYERTAIDPELLKQLRDTNVRFQFFDFPPIDVGEVDFCNTGEGFDNSQVSFKSGKSILFALPENTNEMRQSFNINVTVSRKMAPKEGGEMKLFDLGNTVICLGDSFVNLLEATSYDGICPASRTVRDSYPFSDQNGASIGFVTVFVRLSCFGKIIVTQFQADTLQDKDKSFCFKGGADEAVPATPPDAEPMPAPPCGGGDPLMMPPNFFGGQMPMYQPQTITVPVPLRKKPTVARCGRVPSELISTDSEGEKKGPYCLHRKCPQGYPRPPWVAGGRSRPVERKTMGPPVGAASFKGDDILFQMSNPLDPRQKADARNTLFKVNQEPDQKAQNVQMVTPEYKPEIDDENDVFLIKFGKRDESGKPAKLIVSMKTPKAPMINEHICTSEQKCQTEPPPPPPPPARAERQTGSDGGGEDEFGSEGNDEFTTTEVAEALGHKPGKKAGAKPNKKPEKKKKK